MALLQSLWDHSAAAWSVSVFFISLYLLISLKKWFRIYTMCLKLPGPSQHPILGNALQYLSKHKFFNHCMEWRKSFPDFHKTFVLFHPMIIVQSPECVQKILGRNKHAEKGLIYQALTPLLGEGLVTSKDQKWHTHRKLITPTFHFNILESFVDVFVERTKDFMKKLEEVDKSDFIEISPYTQKLTLDFICETAMGTPVLAQNETAKQSEIVAAMHRLEKVAIYRMVHPWLLSEVLFSLTKGKKEETKYKNVLHTFTVNMIRERRQALKNKKMESSLENETAVGTKKKHIFMDLLIESNDNGQALTDHEIREEVNTFMFAGQNTTQLAINYCLFLLGLHPEVQEQVFEELEKIFGDSERSPTMEDLRQMQVLERCLKEALRLYPSVPVIARRLTEDESIGKHILPAGADVLVLPYVLHRNPTQFPDPEKFNPDNFLPERVKARHPYSYIPFSAGPRNCIGQKFAVLAEKTALSAIIRKYKIETKSKQEDLVVVPSTVLVPKSGIRIKLIPRS